VGVSWSPARNPNPLAGWGYKAPLPIFLQAQRYVFTLYALDAKLGLPAAANKQQLDEALTGHVLGQSHLVGWYARRPR